MKLFLINAKGKVSGKFFNEIFFWVLRMIRLTINRRNWNSSYWITRI